MKVEAPHGPVRERLGDLGAESLGPVHQRDTYYDHPSRDFAETDEALRLRRESAPDDASGDDVPDADPDVDHATGTTATLTYKGPLVDGDSKTREEVESVVADPDATDAVLRAVGFEPAAVVEKERDRYEVDGYLVSLDSVAGLGAFVEVEVKGEVDAVDALREGAFDLCRRLGLDPDASIQTSYLGLLLDADE